VVVLLYVFVGYLHKLLREERRDWITEQNAKGGPLHLIGCQGGRCGLQVGTSSICSILMRSSMHLEG